METRGRHVVYVAYQPKAWLGKWHNFDDEEEARQWCVERRCAAFNELLRTTHWASSVVRVSDKPGPDYKEISALEHAFLAHPEQFMALPELTELGKSLVGLPDLEARAKARTWARWLQSWWAWIGWQ